MRSFLLILTLLNVPLLCAAVETYPPAANEPGTTAVHKGDPRLVAWADGYTNMIYGADSAVKWHTPSKALGVAVGDSYDIVCLGRSGEITMTFSRGITDGDGFDFAVFENAVGHKFLELGWVEVSSDGIHFTRFPNYSLTPSLVLAFGELEPTFIHGFGGKYIQGYGTPFDLDELRTAADEIAEGGHHFSSEYVSAFNANYSYLDMALITHVRIIDVVGDGSVNDSGGYAIYDPFMTLGSAGFDLDAVGVLNQPEDERANQVVDFEPIPHQRLSFQTLELYAVADSGLPVALSVQSGPATNSGNVLYFTGTGTVEVVASQQGDTVYMPAAPVLRSFRVADEIQHIFVEPIPNQGPVVGFKTLQAYSSSGLPVLLEVHEGPASVMIGPTNHMLTLSGDAGDVTVRAYQPGNAVTAPAEDVFVRFQVLEAADAGQLVSFADWLTSNAVPDVVFQPLEDAYGRTAFKLEYTFDPNVQVSLRVIQSVDLVSWTNAVPEILEMSSSNVVLQLSAEETNCFYRLEFEGQ